MRIRCRDQEHIARELRRRATSDSLFVPSQAPPDAGTTQEFLFYVPDGPEVRVEAQVLQSIPPERGGNDSSGMLVSFSEAAAAAADSLDAGTGAQTDRKQRARRVRAAMMPGPRESQSLHSGAERRRVLEALEAELIAMDGRTDHEVLFLEEDADLPAVRAAYTRLVAQYDPKHFASHDSPVIMETIGRIVSRMRQAHERLARTLHEAAPEPVQLSLTPHERSNPLISDAAALITGAAYVDAQRSLSAALRDNPEDSDARVWLLIAKARQAETWKDFEAAKAHYRAALSIDRDHRVATRGLARAAALGVPDAVSMPAGRLRRPSGRRDSKR